jgi:hypothetical protein
MAPMKGISLACLVFIFCATPLEYCAQGIDPGSSPERSVIEKGPSHRVWKTIKQSPDGREMESTYTELADGLHYWDNGEWKESEAVIEIFGDNAIARRGQHKVIFSANLNSENAIDMESPAGKQFRVQADFAPVF